MVYLLTGTLPAARRLQPLHACENDWLLHKATIVSAQLPSLRHASALGHIWQH